MGRSFLRRIGDTLASILLGHLMPPLGSRPVPLDACQVCGRADGKTLLRMDFDAQDKLVARWICSPCELEVLFAARKNNRSQSAELISRGVGF